MRIYSSSTHFTAMSETQAESITRFIESITETDCTPGIDRPCHSCWKRPRYEECPTFKDFLGNNRYLCKPCMKDARPDKLYICRVPPKQVRDRIKQKAAQNELMLYLCECCSIWTRQVCICHDNLRYEVCSECAILIERATPLGKTDADVSSLRLNGSCIYSLYLRAVNVKTAKRARSTFPF